MSASGIYFLRGAGLIKIGKSKSVPHRVADIQRMCPIQLELVGVIHAEHCGLEGIERWFHSRYAHLRQHGEWFTPCEEMLSFATGTKPFVLETVTGAAKILEVSHRVADRIPNGGYMGPRGGWRLQRNDLEEIAAYLDGERAREQAERWLKDALTFVRNGAAA